MTKPRSSMKKGQGSGGFDLDAFVGAADPITSEVQETPQEQPKPARPRSKPKTAKPVPWDTSGEGPLVKISMKMTPRQKAILDYLRDETGVPTAQRLLRATMPDAETEARDRWRKGQGG